MPPTSALRWIDRVREIVAAATKLLSAPTGMARTRDLPSAHAPFRDGPATPMFQGFDDTLGPEDYREEDPLAERVAARFVAAREVIPFHITGPVLAMSDVREALRRHGVDVDGVRFEPGSWPGQADMVGFRGDTPVMHGAVTLDLRVDGEHARIHAEIRIMPEDA